MTFRVRLHLLLDEPNSSPAAKALSAFCGVNILVSTLIIVLETMISGPRSKQPANILAVWQALEVYFTVLFTVELVLRFWVADALGTQTKKHFARNPRNICDFVAICPWYFEVMFSEALRAFRLFRIIRLARLSRLARVSRLAHWVPLAAPISMVLVVVWGIFLLNEPE